MGVTEAREARIELHLDDLELDDVNIIALSQDDAKGLPDMGATMMWVGCCSCCST